jgi:hypothetical protein
MIFVFNIFRNFIGKYYLLKAKKTISTRNNNKLLIFTSRIRFVATRFALIVAGLAGTPVCIAFAVAVAMLVPLTAGDRVLCYS